MNCGHCNPEITKKVQEQVGTLQHVCNIYLTENFVNLAEKLAEVTPGKLQKTFFCSTGSEATEGALLPPHLHGQQRDHRPAERPARPHEARHERDGHPDVAHG